MTYPFELKTGLDINNPDVYSFSSVGAYGVYHTVLCNRFHNSITTPITILASDANNEMYSVATGLANQVLAVNTTADGFSYRSIQEVNPDDNVTFASITADNLTPLSLVISDPSNKLVSLANGTSNQVLGMNAAGTEQEYKTLNGTINQISIAHAINSITFSTPQDIAPISSPSFYGLTIAPALDSDAEINLRPTSSTGASACKVRLYEGLTNRWTIQNLETFHAFQIRNEVLGTFPFQIAGASDVCSLLSARINDLTAETIVSCDINKQLQSLVMGSNVTLTSNILSANIGTSPGQGVNYYLDDANIIAASSENFCEVNTLTSQPVTATPETTDSKTVTAASSPGYMEAYRTTAGLGRTFFDAGAWIYNIYAYCSSTAGGISKILICSCAIIEDTIIARTVTMTGAGTTRTVTASVAGSFNPIMVNVDKTLAWHIETPKGIYPITSFTSDTIVTITVPVGYINESGVNLIVWARLFHTGSTLDHAALSTALTLYDSTYAEMASAGGTAAKLGVILFASTTRVTNTTISFTHNGHDHYSWIRTPFSTLHDSLAEIHLAGTGIIYGHVDDQAQNFYGIKTFNSPPVVTGLNSIIYAATGTLSDVTIGSSLTFATPPTLDTIQDIRTTASPNFHSIILGSSAGSASWSEIRAAAINACGIDWYSGSDLKWGLYRPASSNDFRLYDYAAARDLLSFSTGGGIKWTGSNADITGAHLLVYTSTSASYPVFTQYNWSQDNISLNFDAYFDGTNWKSSDSGSNYQILKNSDQVLINYKSGVAQGSNITWVRGFSLDIGGNASIGNGTRIFTNDAVGGALQVVASTAGASWTGRGVFGGPNNRIVFGELSGVAYIGGHNATLNGWTKLNCGSAFSVDYGNSLHVHSSGGVYYGIIYYNDSDLAKYWLQTNQSNYYLGIYYAGNWRGDFSPVDGTYTKSSDRRLKTNIKPIINALDRIKPLEVVTYTMIGDKENEVKLGLIHDNVLPTVPEICSWKKMEKNSDELYGGISYDGFGVLAIQGIKEQQVIIDKLKARIELMEMHIKNITKLNKL